MNTDKEWVYFDLIKEQLWNTPQGIFNLNTLTQWTGLLDKSGKEIYEGDIVKHGNGIQQVTYDDENISFQMVLSDHVLDQETGSYEYVEVIGNIYENPELLK